jgi:WD40 repeat protein
MPQAPNPKRRLIAHRVSDHSLCLRIFRKMLHREGCINAIAGHPTNVAMLASCSDDGALRIWVPDSRNQAILACTSTHYTGSLQMHFI